MKKLAIAMGLCACCIASLYGQHPDRAYEKGRFKEAEAGYKKALNKTTESATLLYNLGNATYQQGSFRTAANLYEQALNLSVAAEDKADTWHNLGNARFYQQDYAGAVQAYQNSLRWRPGDQDSKYNLFLAKQKLLQQQEQPSSDNNAKPGQDDAPNDTGAARPQAGAAPSPSRPDNKTAGVEDARQHLESMIQYEDQRNTRKYRSGEQPKRNILLDKDW
jgi:tetratricopeptide (TPR) repeat protein